MARKKHEAEKKHALRKKEAPPVQDMPDETEHPALSEKKKPRISRTVSTAGGTDSVTAAARKTVSAIRKPATETASAFLTKNFLLTPTTDISIWHNGS